MSIDKRNKKRRKEENIIIWAIFIIILAIIFVGMGKTMRNINEKKDKLVALKSEYSNILSEQATLKKELEGDSDSYEKYARENGYAYPNDRVYQYN